MGNLLYGIAVLLIIIWAIGLFAYHAGGLIHILLILAIVSIVWRLMTHRPGHTV